MVRRVVITGMGLISPLAQGLELSWKRLIAGQSGAGQITAFDTTDYACTVACEIPMVDGRGGGGPDIEGSFDPSLTLSNKERRKVDDFILYAIAAADEALN
jgi:3-oxoacyl-[acyl-carrier-protein] synthase II